MRCSFSKILSSFLCLGVFGPTEAWADPGDFIGVFASGGGLADPRGLAFGPDGNLYVSSLLTNEVLRYDGDTGAFMDVFASGGGLDAPFGLVFGPDGNLYVASVETSEIIRFDGATGAFIDVFASIIGAPQYPLFGLDGNLYVSTTGDFVVRFEGATGSFIDYFAGVFNPRGIAFGPDDNLYVCSDRTDADQVRRFDGSTGDFIDVFASGGGLDFPQGVVFGPDGNLYVCSRSPSSVLRFDGKTGEFIDTFTSGNMLTAPIGLAFGPDGNLYVASASADQVLKYEGFDVAIDIRPGSCRNSFNRTSNGVLPIALLGSDTFDVSQVELGTIRLTRADSVGGDVTPLEGSRGPSPELEDVGAFFVGGPCDCLEAMGDGITDLSLKFKSQEIVDALELSDLPNGLSVELKVSGYLLNGTPFSASDCIRLVPPAGGALLTVESNAQDVYIGVSPADNVGEGGGFGSFTRAYSYGRVVTVTAPAAYKEWIFVGWSIDLVGRSARPHLTPNLSTLWTSQRSIDIPIIGDHETVHALYVRSLVSNRGVLRR